MEDEFDKYTSNYDMSNPGIANKYKHSYRVMDLCEKYAIKLGWDTEDVYLAKLIGLLHDFGRFEQLRRFKSFNDRDTIDHADYSATVLFDDGYIKNFCDKEELYPIIRYAIVNHNKLFLPEVNDERMLRLGKLIRDIDKLDIIYLLGTLGEYDYQSDDSEISKDVYDATINGENIDKSKIKTKNDDVLLKMAFVYDVNYDEVLVEYKEYFKNFYERVENGKFKEVYTVLMNYIDKRLEK